MISDNVKRCMEKINAASAKSDFDEKITLVAVTKTRGIEEINEILDCGIINLGENRVQEFNEKFPLIKREANWHIIGSLQTNKVKYLMGKVSLIHSVDSLHLAEAINAESEKHSIITDILLQVNTANEESKHGIELSEAVETAEQIALLGNVKLKGVMMIAPNTDESAYLSKLFLKTRNIFDELMKLNAKYDNIQVKILSMGMSNDYETAIACGSNMLRLGRTLFA